MTKTILFILLALLLAGIVIFLCKKVIKGIVMKVIVIILAVILFTGGGAVINLNSISAEAQTKIQQVTDIVGSSSIKTEGNKVLIKIDNDWYDVSKLSILGVDVSGDITLKYEGTEIKVCQSGVTNAIEILKEAGFLQGDKN